MTHRHTCPQCGFTWVCFGVWADKAKVKTPETCEVTLGRKTGGGYCMLCYHLGMAANYAQHRFSDKPEPLLTAVREHLKHRS